MKEQTGIREILLILTAQCNSRCRYCYQTAKCDSTMQWDTLRSAIELSLASHGPEVTLVFLGGEPLLQFTAIRRAVAYLAAAKPADKQIRYEISTNGLLLTTDVASFLEREEFAVQLSFDGVEQAQEIRAPGTFAVIDALLDRLRRDHHSLFHRRLRVCITLVPGAIPYLFDSVRYLASKGVRRIGISPSLLYHPEWCADRLRELEHQFVSIFDHSLELFRHVGETPVLFLRKEAEEEDGPVTEAMCALADGKRVAVDVDGQVYGCAMLAESYQDLSGGLLWPEQPSLRLGDVRDPGLVSRFSLFPGVVARSELFHHKLRKYSSYARCAECEYAGACSVCPASIARNPCNTDPRRVPDFVCAFNRTALRYRRLFPAMPHPLGRFGELLMQARKQRLAGEATVDDHSRSNAHR